MTCIMPSQRPSDLAGVLAARRPPPVEPPTRSDKPPHADERAAARILVVEDDWFVGMETEAVLNDAGFNVLDVVVSARGAIDVARETRPELIIMDVRLMGEVDGVDAAIEIRQRFDIPCLFVTAYEDASLRLRAEAARPVGWLVKPISGDALVAAVKGWFGRG